MAILWLLLGIVLAGVLVAWARTRRDGGRRVFAIALVIASAIYLGFAIRGAGTYWLLVEGLGMLLYGVFAWLGVRGSHLWLAAGWALHPLWDVGLHRVGPAQSFAPAWYATACISFDLLVAGYLLLRFRASRTGMGSAVDT